LFYRGAVKKILGDYQGAMNDYDQSIRLNPLDAQAFNNRGNVRMLFGDYTLAIQDYDQSIRLRENYGIAYFNRGIAKLMLLKKDTACDDFKLSEQYGYEAAAETIRDFCTLQR
jgi:tetratricopeptide (TPR) repeat protein